MRVRHSRENFLFLSAMGVCLLLSAWINLRETVINPDAICYLMSSHVFSQSGLRAAMHFCPQAKWPFYSILISGITQLTHFSYMTSAYLLDGFFTLLSVWLFLKIIKELGGNERVLWFAALVILFSHEFNSVRQYIIRDHGFWTFYLTSLLVLLHYLRNPTYKGAFLFSISLIIATLFRIEGAFFLFGLPCIILFSTSCSFVTRLKHFFMLHLPVIFISATLIAWLLFHPEQNIDKFGRIAEIGNQLQHGFFLMVEQYQTTKLALIHHVLTPDAARDAGLVLFLVLMTWYLLNVVTNLSWIYCLLTFYAWRSKAASFDRHARLVLGGYLSINLIITLGFFVQHLFLSKRYLIALSFIFMFWVPFALDKLYQHRANTKYKIALLLAVFFILISSLGGLFNFGPSKSYIHEAGSWIANNVPVGASLYVNDYQLMYYTQHFNTTLFEKLPTYMDINTIAHGRWKQYDYLALRLNKKEDAQFASLLQEISFMPTKVFMNKRGDQVVVYRIKENLL